MTRSVTRQQKDKEKRRARDEALKEARDKCAKLPMAYTSPDLCEHEVNRVRSVES